MLSAVRARFSSWPTAMMRLLRPSDTSWYLKSPAWRPAGSWPAQLSIRPNRSPHSRSRPPVRVGAGMRTAVNRSAQRRERGRDDQHILLPDHHVRPAAGWWWPDTLRSRLLADAEAVGRILIGPDVTPFVEPPELGVPRADERRQLDPPRDVPAPAIYHALNAAGFERIDTDLVKIAE